MSSVHWSLVVCGISHKTSTLEQREPLQIGHDEMASAHADIMVQSGVFEATIVSTCNRVEFYLVMDRSEDPFGLVRRFYRDFNDVDIADLESNFYVRRGKHAAEHLFSVTAGVDSMVLGENQIAGQVREAYSSACAIKSAGKVIHRLFHQAFRVGKAVRTDTEMGKGACSVSSASLELLKDGLETDARPTVLFVGVNKMIELAASGWSKLHHRKLLFANRTVEKAVALAAKFKAEGYPLTDLPQLLGEADIVVTCTGSTQPIITRTTIDEYLANHPGRSLVIMDMAIPRDTEIDSGYDAMVVIYDLDDVKAFVRERQRRREAAIPEAEKIIGDRRTEFAYWYDHARRELTFDGLLEMIEDICRQELEPTWQALPEAERQKAEESARSLAKRLVQVKLRTLNGAHERSNKHGQ